MGSSTIVKHTECWKINPENPEPELLAVAGQALRDGKLVAFPTETVYGLGANALDYQAVAGIFEAKGRPATNPLIVHLAEVEQVHTIASEWSTVAAQLATRFWPGPLTLIVPKLDVVPDLVTAGGSTVGIRIPAHPVARALIAAAQVPVAAPSANRFTQVSPTTAQHVLKGLSGRIDLVLDGGPTHVGIESTVLDVSVSPPVLWRSGMLSQAELEQHIGPIVLPYQQHTRAIVLPSPGQHRKHYAPKADVHLVPYADRDALRHTLERLVPGLSAESPCVGYIAFEPAPIEHPAVIVNVMPARPRSFARALYAVFHAMEDAGVAHLIIEDVPPESAWNGVRDRLHRAAVR